MAWKGYGSYGDSALGADFYVSGLDELLEKVRKAGDSVDDAVSDAVKEAAPILLDSQKDGAARHRKGTGKYGTDAFQHIGESVNFSSHTAFGKNRDVCWFHEEIHKLVLRSFYTVWCNFTNANKGLGGVFVFLNSHFSRLPL